MTQHTPDFTKLKKLAQAATQGKWIKLHNEPCEKEVSITTKGRRGCEVPICELDTHYRGNLGKEQKANASYLAEANPSTIIDLIERLLQPPCAAMVSMCACLINDDLSHKQPDHASILMLSAWL